MEQRRGIALVTGSSSGIGLACVRALAADGWHVVATARTPERADALAEVARLEGNIELRRLDVTEPASVTACVDGILDDHGGIDVLVNNAGTGHRGTLEQVTDDEMAACFAVNFWGVVATTRAVLPAMRARRRGRIVTVTSMNGVVGMPFSDAYNAAKFAVEGLMEGLAGVLRHVGIAVSVLEPGPVRTAFLHNARGWVGDDVPDDDPYAGLLRRYNAAMAAFHSSGEAPADVGELVCRIAREPRPHLRYQSSAAATAMVARKLVDPTGDTIVDATAGLLAAAT